MTTEMLPFFQPIGTLFLTLPDTDFARYCLELDQLVREYPEILKRIGQDLEKDGFETIKIVLEWKYPEEL